MNLIEFAGRNTPKSREISTTNTTPTLLTKVITLGTGASKLLAKIMVYLHIINTIIWAHPILDFLNIMANVSSHLCQLNTLLQDVTLIGIHFACRCGQGIFDPSPVMVNVGEC